MKYTEFKECVMNYAKELHLAEYELFYTESQEISAGALMNELSEFSVSDGAGACFRCIFEGKMGYAATELFTEEEALRIVEASMANAKAIENEDQVFIHGAGDTYETVEVVDTKEPTGAELSNTVLGMLKHAFTVDDRVIDGSQTMAGYCKQRVALCNSKGLDLDHSFNYSMAGAFACVKEGDKMYDGYCMKADDFAKLNMEELVEKAVEEAVSTIGDDSIDSGVYPVVFSNKIMATLLSTYFSVFSAEQAQRGLSLLANKEGELIASELVQVVDDPFCAETLIRMPFDGEGVATHKTSVIADGKLCTLLHNLATANKAGVKSTGNGRKAGYAAPVSVLPYNFYMEKGTAGTKEDIFQTMGDGIYVTGLNGLHAGANQVTGDFSLAAEGFLISGGKKSHVIKNFTVSGNFLTLLKNIALVGSDLEFTTPSGGCSFGAPTVMVKDISVAGK